MNECNIRVLNSVTYFDIGNMDSTLRLRVTDRGLVTLTVDDNPLSGGPDVPGCD